MSSIADNTKKVTTRIEKAALNAGRQPHAVQLLAVSKRQSVAALQAAIAAGLRAFGENYLQEALPKMAALQPVPGLVWHFIGPIQTNKTRDIAASFHWVHSLDRLKIAQRLNEQRPDEMPPLNVCIQVNIDQEASKSGTSPDQVISLAAAILQLPRLRLRGLMTLPPADLDDGELHLRFASLRLLLLRLQKLYPDHPELDTLSMGMSSDLEIAISEGATLVRIGTALFGERAP